VHPGCSFEGSGARCTGRGGSLSRSPLRTRDSHRDVRSRGGVRLTPVAADLNVATAPPVDPARSRPSRSRSPPMLGNMSDLMCEPIAESEHVMLQRRAIAQLAWMATYAASSGAGRRSLRIAKTGADQRARPAARAPCRTVDRPGRSRRHRRGPLPISPVAAPPGRAHLRPTRPPQCQRPRRPAPGGSVRALRPSSPRRPAS